MLTRQPVSSLQPRCGLLWSLWQASLHEREDIVIHSQSRDVRVAHEAVVDGRLFTAQTIRGAGHRIEAPRFLTHGQSRGVRRGLSRGFMFHSLDDALQ